MAKTLTITHEGTKYTLEFTRRSIELMEKQGFNINELDSKIMTSIRMLVRGAFLAHHRNIPDNRVDDIYAHIPNKEDFISKLATMYSEPLETLMAEPTDEMGKAEWETNW